MENIKIREQVKQEMTRRFPQKELEYRNGVVASAIAQGHKDKLTEDWLMKTLLNDVEDDFITYEQAVAVRVDYMKAIEEVKKMF